MGPALGHRRATSRLECREAPAELEEMGDPDWVWASLAGLA